MVEVVTEPIVNYLGINQIKAADGVYKTLEEMSLDDPTLQAVKETDIFRLRRGLCLPCAAATCVNNLFGKKVIGEDKINDGSSLTIGDFFRLLLPLHNQKNLINKQGQVYQNPWFVVDKEGNLYHQAVIAFAQGLEIEAVSVLRFSDIKDFFPFVRQGGNMAVSLDNNFVLEQTLGLDPNFVEEKPDGYYIRIEGPNGLEFRRFESGRHIVSILGINNEGILIVHDSFVLPQMTDKKGTLVVDPETINQYLKYKNGGETRGIVFYPKGYSLSLTGIEKFINNNIFIPDIVVQRVKKLIS